MQLYLPPSTNNEWTVRRSLRGQVAKTGAIAKAHFRAGNVNFILIDCWDGFLNPLSGFVMVKNMLIDLKKRSRVLPQLVYIPVWEQLASSGQLLIVQRNLAPFLAGFAQGKLPLFETNS